MLGDGFLRTNMKDIGAVRKTKIFSLLVIDINSILMLLILFVYLVLTIQFSQFFNKKRLVVFIYCLSGFKKMEVMKMPSK